LAPSIGLGRDTCSERSFLFACTCCEPPLLAFGACASSAKTSRQAISGTSNNPKTIRRITGCPQLIYPKLTLWSGYPVFGSKLWETWQGTRPGHTNPPEFGLED
jgi:hypothetical protein